MQADNPPIRGGNQDLLYRPLGKIQLWACTCKQEPLLYLRLSTKTDESYGKHALPVVCISITYTVHIYINSAKTVVSIK